MRLHYDYKLASDYAEKTCRMVRNMHVMHEKALEDQMAGREEGIVLTSTPGTF